MGESHHCHCIFLLSYYIKKITHYILYWWRLLPVHRHPPAGGYNLHSFSNTHWKGAKTPWSYLSDPTTREILLPHWSLKPSTPCGLHFIMFHTTSTYQQIIETYRKPFIKFSHWTTQKISQNQICQPKILNHK